MIEIRGGGKVLYVNPLAVSVVQIAEDPAYEHGIRVAGLDNAIRVPKHEAIRVYNEVNEFLSLLCQLSQNS